MASYSYSGKIVWVGEVETFSSGFKKRVFVVCPNPDDKWPDTIAFELTSGKKRDMTNDIVETDVGLDAEVKFYVSSRKYEKNGKVSWFTSTRAAEVSVARPEATETQKAEQPAKTIAQDSVVGNDEDLPF